MIGGHGPVCVGVQVDETRGDVQAGCVDDPGRGRRREVSHRHDTIAGDRDVRTMPGVARTIEDASAPNQNVGLSGCGGRHQAGEGHDEQE